MKRILLLLVFILVSLNSTGVHSAEQWDPERVYAAPGATVEFDDKMWANHWWTKGESPAGYYSNPWHVWRPVDDNSPGIVTEPGNPEYPEWNSNKVYADPGEMVMFNGGLWKNLWWTKGEPPDGYYGDPWYVWRPVEHP